MSEIYRPQEKFNFAVIRFFDVLPMLTYPFLQVSDYAAEALMNKMLRVSHRIEGAHEEAVGIAPDEQDLHWSEGAFISAPIFLQASSF